MSRHRILGSLVLALAFLPARAHPREASPFTLEVLVDGRPLPRYDARGTRYVEAREGKEYSLRLRNDTGGRIAVALAVDGLNTIDARHTSARDARKWILGPWETVVLDGWQTSSGTARRFFFTSEDRSYGSWLGRTENLGVISAAVFRERPAPPPRPIEEPRPMSKESSSAPSARARADENAATGIGREVDHRVVAVAFDAEPEPASIVEIRYEYRDALVRLGVLPRCESDPALARRERSRGFSTDGFAPDPY